MKLNLKLLRRVSFMGKEKLSFLLLLVPAYLLLLLFCFNSNNPMNELFVSFLVIGGLNYHSLEATSSLRSHYLFPFFISKRKAGLYGILGEIATKFLLVLPFVFLSLSNGLTFVLEFIISAIAFITVLYLLCDLSGINKMYTNLFRVVTIAPIALIDFASIFISEENFIETYFKKNYDELMFNSAIVLIIVLIVVFVIHEKIFYRKIIN